MSEKFNFNLPKGGIKRVLMDACGAICVLFSGHLLVFLLKHAFRQTAVALLLEHTRQALSLWLTLPVCICLLIMLVISYTTKGEEDDKAWFDKLMDLKSPKKFPFLV